MKDTILVLSLFFCIGCQTARMEIPSSLASVSPLEVQGANPRRWNAPISFGPWRTVNVDEGLTWNFAQRLFGLDAGFTFQSYRLAVSSGDEPVQGECTTMSAVLSRKGVSVDPSFGKIPTLACAFRGEVAGEGTLWLETTATNAEEGEIDYIDGPWSVRSIRRFQGSSLPSGTPLGYEITRRNRVIGAIETMNRGRVWIDPSISENDQARMAILAAALLLYEPASAD